MPENDDGHELHLPSCEEDDDANDSGAGSGEGADDEKYSGFVTSDPVINLDVRCSVNEFPTDQEPKGFVPLIGSEVDIRDARSPIPSTSSKCPKMYEFRL